MSQRGNDLLLHYTAVPEAASALPALAASAFLLNRRRLAVRNQHLNACPIPPSF